MRGEHGARWEGRALTELGLPDAEVELRSSMLDAVVRGRGGATFEFEADTVDGHRWFEAVLSPVTGPDGEVVGVIESSRDVTDRVLAGRDALTGLSNRRELADDLERALASNARTGHFSAVLMLDLDRFKLVNDTLGHAAGDELLIAAAARLRSLARGGDLLVRIGGDEFVVVMRDLVQPADALRAGWRVVEAFREPFTVDGHRQVCPASVGVSVSRPGARPDDLVREADTAMYLSKSHGGDTLEVFNEDLRDAVEHRVTVEDQLRGALGSDQLEVWFQPEVDPTTGEVQGAEALLRWRHPDGTTWNAGAFIDIAEDAGLIVPIGVAVLESACVAAAAWVAAAPERDFVLRVNLSARQLEWTALLDQLDATLARSGLAPGRLCVEITETVLLRPTPTVRANLDGIARRGIGIASDDFGTGYASLAQLREFPIDTLKIDRSFVEHLTHNERDRHLVAAVTALASNLCLDVVAEGVETCEQAAMLVELGCHRVQGFLYSPAVPAAEFTRLLSVAAMHDVRRSTAARSRTASSIGPSIDRSAT